MSDTIEAEHTGEASGYAVSKEAEAAREVAEATELLEREYWHPRNAASYVPGMQAEVNVRDRPPAGRKPLGGTKMDAVASALLDEGAFEQNASPEKKQRVQIAARRALIEVLREAGVSAQAAEDQFGVTYPPDLPATDTKVLQADERVDDAPTKDQTDRPRP
jgi:hypothetical protein